MQGTVLSYVQALQRGISPRLYDFRPEKVPIGKMQAILDCKIWGGKVMGIGCYFSRSDDGRKFLVTVYYDAGQNGYRLEGSDIDFHVCPVKTAYWIEVGTNGRGNPVLKGMSWVDDLRQTGNADDGNEETVCETS